MRRRAWIFAFSALSASASAFFVACVGDDPVDTTPAVPDSGGGGSDAPSGGDTGMPVEDGGVLGDAAQPSDAGVDSACANTFPAADFCDDFDNGGYQPAWKKTENGAGVTISLVSSPNHSTPHALAAYTMKAVPDGGGASTTLTVERPTAGAGEFTLQARVRQLEPVNVFDVNSSPISLQLVVGLSASLNFYIRPNAGVAVCTAPGQFIGGSPSAAEMPFAYNEWHLVTLKAAFADGGTVIALSCNVDGNEKNGVANNTVVNANAAAVVGLAATGGLGPTTYFFDDVVLDIK